MMDMAAVVGVITIEGSNDPSIETTGIAGGTMTMMMMMIGAVGDVTETTIVAIAIVMMMMIDGIEIEIATTGDSHGATEELSDSSGCSDKGSRPL